MVWGTDYSPIAPEYVPVAMQRCRERFAQNHPNDALPPYDVLPEPAQQSE